MLRIIFAAFRSVIDKNPDPPGCPGVQDEQIKLFHNFINLIFPFEQNLFTDGQDVFYLVILLQ
jgi:hypothetical protein